MSETVKWVGLDVHARSVVAAVVSAQTGELRRPRFGGEAEPVAAWLAGLPGPVHACYEAGPTGYGLARACAGAGVRRDVIAPSKTPRAAGERVKTDRRDDEIRILASVEGTNVLRVAEMMNAPYEDSRARANGKLLLASRGHSCAGRTCAGIRRDGARPPRFATSADSRQSSSESGCEGAHMRRRSSRRGSRVSLPRCSTTDRSSRASRCLRRPTGLRGAATS